MAPAEEMVCVLTKLTMRPDASMLLPVFKLSAFFVFRVTMPEANSICPLWSISWAVMLSCAPKLVLLTTLPSASVVSW